MRHFFIILGFVFAILLNSCAPRVVKVQPARTTTVIKVAPKKHKIVVIKGKRYYYWNGRYHKKTRRGFVVVRV